MSALHQISVLCLKPFSLAYLVTGSAIFTWKGCFLPYYLPTYLSEFLLLLIIGLLQFFCILLSYINLQRFSLILTVPILLSIVYFLVWQQYVLFIELITNSFCIAFQVFYTLTAITDKLA